MAPQSREEKNAKKRAKYAQTSAIAKKKKAAKVRNKIAAKQYRDRQKRITDEQGVSHNVDISYSFGGGGAGGGKGVSSCCCQTFVCCCLVLSSYL